MPHSGCDVTVFFLFLHTASFPTGGDRKWSICSVLLIFSRPHGYSLIFLSVFFSVIYNWLSAQGVVFLVSLEI